MTTRAVFIDKDGTLIRDVPMNVDPELMRLTDGAADGLRRLHGAGFRVAVVSNQAGVAHGAFPERALDAVVTRLRELLDRSGVPLDGFYYCPHHPEARVERYRVTCECRKPAPGLVLRAAESMGADLEQSWMVGDILDDVEAGRRAGCRTVLFDSGGETEWVITPSRTPDFMARRFSEVVDHILGASEVA
jgi:histidinol-phosphate phosphatase family protein